MPSDRASAAIAPVTFAVRETLGPLRNRREAPDDNSRHAAVEALTRLQGSLHQQDALTAVWRDLVDAVKAPVNLDTLRFRADCLVNMLSRADRSVNSTMRVAEGVLADGALWQLEARLLLGDEHVTADLVWPSPDAAGGLTEDERETLCERLVVAAPEPRQHVVWVAFDHAGVRAHPGVTVGAVQFYEADLIRSAVAAGAAATPLPPELFRNHLSEHDIPQGNVVMARVDLGTRILADAPSKARQLARTLVEAAVFKTSIEDATAWTPLDDYIHFVDGRYSGGSHYARDLIPLGRLAQETIGDELQSLAATALSDADWHAEHLDTLEALTWFRHAAGLAAAPRLMLDVRVLERVAVQAGIDDPSWWQYLDDFWKVAWARHQLFERIVLALRHCLRTRFMSPPEIDPSARATAAELLSSVVRTVDHLRYEVSVPAGVRLLPQLAELFSPYSVWGSRLIMLAQRTSTVDGLRKWVDATEKDWDRLRHRAQRSRNALTHGGPLNAKVIDSSARFVLAAFALSEELTAVANRVNVDAAHADLAENARRWRAHLLDAPDAASSLAGGDDAADTSS